MGTPSPSMEELSKDSPATPPETKDAAEQPQSQGETINQEPKTDSNEEKSNG